MGQVLSNLARILFGRKEVKPIHPNSGYGKTRVSEEDEGSVVIVIPDADQVREDVAEPSYIIQVLSNLRSILFEMDQVLSNLARILFGRKKEALKNDEERKPIHPNPGYGKTRVSEEDEGYTDKVREDVAEPFPLVSGDPNTRVSKDERVITITVDSGVEAVENIKPITDVEVREDVEPFLVVSVDPKPKVSEDERVDIIVDSGVEGVEKIKPILHISTVDKMTVPKDVSRAKGRKGRAKQKERRIKHYFSSHKILLVGEGDFSFSACLANVFGSANNMVATSLNSKDFLQENYSNAISNINGLKNRECIVLHGVDATNMSGHQSLRGMKFDRIVFNFPCAGFLKNEYQKSRHQKLVTLFCKNAKKMLSKEGEIHISHKSDGFHREWNIVSLASLSGLNFIKEENFNLNDYPGYNTKRGFGGDENFDCNPSKTYMFGLL
ncbi:uncharacterized protein LOC122057315 [Macadamia integrifolia]|uniref:uncharacterized protein LOC122057315 n=1 Tax=Macadamia integrifolia TaxID=60698 RepID=UPI001C52CB46|nr:uncharacterized protein LOC122057315 [Macadamia integrifolia]